VVVDSPLSALMKDQVSLFEKLDISAAIWLDSDTRDEKSTQDRCL
jgi:superfamily II DNA helicase RecQ